ncbi:hypothetical protein K8R33_03535 [archaeon]|nr:hypothetical protein [archaeon]
MKSKKGAIELSMTTIIVIVIGITLLTLGLTWVRSSLGDVMDLTDKAFAMSDQEIEGMFSNSNDLLKIVPSTAELKKGDSAKLGVIFYNLESTTLPFKAVITPVGEGNDIICKFDETLSSTSDEHLLASGANHKLKIIVETTQTAKLGTAGCKVSLTSPTAEQTIYQRDMTILVDIIP